MRSELVNLILSIVKIVIIITAALFFLVHIGVNITGLVASLGIGGLAVALAAKDTLSNFFGLLKILSDNSFSQGDWIAAGDVEGTVVEIGFISTDVRTFDNALITVPNEKLANVPLKNYSRRKVGRRIKMHIGVTYGSDREALAKAIKAIEKMLREHAGTVVPGEYDTELRARLKRKEKRLISVEDKFGIKTSLMVYLDQLSASSMDILIYTFTNTVDWEEWLGIKQDIIFRIWEILENHGLEFAFPSQSLYFDKDNLGEAVAPVLKKPADS
ncbi:MAG: mechanosensitive ion channel family protein [Campylobacterales bacterium]